MTKILSCGVAVLALGVAVLAQDAPLASISKVVKEERAAVTTPMVASAVPSAGSQLPKFFEDDARRGETFGVYWSAVGQGLAPGATVMFEYVLEEAPEIRAQHIQYDFKTAGARKAVFTIPEKDFREGGKVKAWRVRILRGRLLAERTSPNWKDAAERK
jgi:hypothetical protein